MEFAESASSPIRKRRKGATRLSCAECRRLKLRCDRGVPCSSCVKRGCGAICPDGSLTTGQGNRFVLASTQELHEKIQELANRVRQLEDALRASHSQVSSEQHPLLADELLRIKAPLQREPAPNKNTSSAQGEKEEANPDIVDAFGSLSIISGREKYYGQTANSWLFLQNESPDERDHDDCLERLRTELPPDILRRAASFPISPKPPECEKIGLQAFYWYLPSLERALELRNIYYSHAAWMYNPISIESFNSQIYSQFYGPTASTTSGPEPLMYHRLSLVFIILAIGSLMDTNLPAYNVEAEKYHQIARAALFHDSLFDDPTIHAVQALFLMTFYVFLADRHGTSSGVRWSLMGIAVKLAQSIGLHRDSGRWKIDVTETQTRRELFWELFTYDSWQCHTFGRPPSFTLAHVDTKMPFISDTSDEQSYHAWKHRFASECMNVLHDQAFGARMPTYATILQLDRKMRAFPVPPVLQVAGFGSSEPRPGGYPETVMLTLQRHIVLAIRETNLLYLHRGFFARAISDHPKDPLGSPYGTSVIAAYRSAGSLVALMRNLHTQLKEPSERLWFLWTHMFSCAIVLGSIVTRCPSMHLAPSALQQLDSACDLFSKAARGFRAEKVLSIMLQLQVKAHSSLDEFKKGRDSPLNKYTMPSTMDTGSPLEDDDELSMLGGKTRLVKKEPSSPTLDRSPSSHNPVVPLPWSPSMENNPQVLAYLRTFGGNDTWTGQDQSQGSAATRQNSGSYGEVSPGFGMPPLPNSPSFHSEPMTFNVQQQHPQQHHLSQSHQQYAHSAHMAQHQRNMSGGMNGPTATSMAAASSFPQYFPVYDYGVTAGVGGHGNVNGYPPSPMTESNHTYAHAQRRGSGSPDGNMQAVWQDFVVSNVVPTGYPL